MSFWTRHWPPTVRPDGLPTSARPAGSPPSAALRLVQPRTTRRCDVQVVGAGARGWQSLQHAKHAAQAVQDASTLRALLGVALDARAGARRELAVEVRGHVARGPAVIAHEARAMQDVAHQRWDPTTILTRSHSQS